jgi:hypothetical protein
MLSYDVWDVTLDSAIEHECTPFSARRLAYGPSTSCEECRGDDVGLRPKL